VAVFGAGSFGQNHIRVYRKLEQDGHPVHLAAIIDPAVPDLTTLKLPDTPLAPPRLFATADECLAAHQSGVLKLDAASICTPTTLHGSIAAAVLDAGIHALVEKPITRTLAEADDLVARAKANNLVLQVGHLERFNPAVRAFVPYLNKPMFFEAHRLSIFTPRSLDVDVVLDLMVHDLDVVLSFANSPVREIRAVGLPILSGKTDIANVRVEFESGCIANFTASRVSTERVRKLRFFQPHQYVSIDYARQEILIIETTADPAGPKQTAALPPDSINLPQAPGLKLARPSVTPGEPLRLEIEAFLNAIVSRSRPIVSGEDGRAALALALDITAAIDAHIAAHMDRFDLPHHT
jgi:predicted dehydrogenase